MQHFHIGQTVMADGREATYAFAHAGTHYVYTVAGLVPAFSVHDLDLGAPRQLQLGGSLRRAVHIARITPRPFRIIPLRRLAA